MHLPNGPLYTFDPYDDRPWQESFKAMYEDGVRLFSFLLPLTVTWQPAGTFDFTVLEPLLDDLQTMAPEGHFLPRVFLSTPPWWDARHPEELLRFSGQEPAIPRFSHENQPLWHDETKIYHSVHNASMASERWLADASRALEAFLNHALHRNFPLFGAMPAYGTCGEWGQFGSYISGMFGNADFSSPMLRRFRQDLRITYGSDQALQKAWESPDVTLDTALPPTKLQRMNTQLAGLRSPRFHQPCLDYFETYATILSEAVEHFCSTIKAIRTDWLAGVFGGQILQAGSSVYMLHQGQTHRVLDKLLALPSLDFLASPSIYHENRLQGVYLQTPADTVCRRKKLFIAECDTVTSRAKTIRSCQPEENLNQFLMETGANLCTGNGLLWWYDFGRGWYLDQHLRNIIRQVTSSWQDLPKGFHACQDIAFVISPDVQALAEGWAGYQQQANRLLYKHLPRCQCSFTIMTDEELTTQPPCRLYIFRDKWHCEPSEARRLRHFLHANHASAIWIGPAGAIRHDQVDLSSCQDLTGFPLKAAAGPMAVSITLTNDRSPLLAGRLLPCPMAPVEDLETVAPVALYADGCPENCILGLVESLDLPGLVIHEGDQRFDLWCATPQLDFQLLTALARHARIIPRFQSDAPVSLYGNGELLTLRADEDARLTFSAPMVSALNNRLLGRTFHLRKGETIIVKNAGQTGQPLKQGQPTQLRTSQK